MQEHKFIDAVRRNRALTPRGAIGRSSIPRYGRCHYLTVTVKEAIELVASGDWQIPDFQREFVEALQVCDLADSLWRDYPIGALLLWLNRQDNQAGASREWRIDRGRSSSPNLSAFYLHGEPRWLESKTVGFRREMRPRFIVYFDVAARNNPRFLSADSHDTGRPGLIPELLALNPETTRTKINYGDSRMNCIVKVAIEDWNGK